MLNTTEVGPRKEVAEISHFQVQAAASEPTATRDKAVGKRPLAPSSEKSSEVLEDNNGDEAWKARFFRVRSEASGKKMRAEKEEVEEDLKSEEDIIMQPFKGTMAAFGEIRNEFLKIGRKNAELYRDVEAAKMVAESAKQKAKESDSRAENAEKAKNAEIEVAKLELMMNLCNVTGNYITMALFKGAELYQEAEATKEDLVAVMVANRSALKKAKDSNKRAVKAEKSLEDVKKALKDSSKKVEEWSKRAVMAEKSLKDYKKALKELSKKVEEILTAAEEVEKALNNVVITLINCSRSAIEKAVARGLR